MGSIRNIVVLTIMQVAVIVVGVLAAGICHRVFTDHNNTAMPLPAALLYWHGVIGLLIPVAWGVGTIVLHLRADVSDGIKTLAFWLGVFILILITAFVLYANVTPWLLAMHWNPPDNTDQ